MQECEKLASCGFIKEAQKDAGLELACRGIVRKYCTVDGQDQCMRKKAGKALGGPMRVPLNLMPNGLKIPGTDNSDWTDELKQVLGLK